MKASAKNPRLRGQTLGRNKDRLVTATEDDIFKLLIKYDGRCCKTNVIFPLVNCKSHCTQWKNFGFNPFELTNHAVLLVGYGTDAVSGQDYWLVSFKTFQLIIRISLV